MKLTLTFDLDEIPNGAKIVDVVPRMIECSSPELIDAVQAVIDEKARAPQDPTLPRFFICYHENVKIIRADGCMDSMDASWEVQE